MKVQRLYLLRVILLCMQGCKSLLSIGGDNLQFYPNFALFSTLGGMNLDHHFFQVSKLSEEPKKRSSPKMEHPFSPISGEDQKKGLHKKWNQARSQKFAMRGLIFGSGGGASSCRRPIGAGGVGARPLAAGSTAVWGRSPQRSKILHFLQK